MSSTTTPQSDPSPPVRRRGATLAPACAALAGMIAISGPVAALTINVTYDSSITTRANASAIEAAFESVVRYFEAAISNPFTLNLHVAWGKVNTTPLASGNVAETRVNAIGFYNFATTRALLINGGVTAPLPVTDPTGRNLFLIPTAQAKALGVTGVTYPAYDAFIGFSATLPFAAFDSSVSPLLAYDFSASAAHEIEHALGRVSGLIGASPVFAYPADLFRFTAPGTPSFAYNAGAYASIDGGATSLGGFNSDPAGGDRVDWAAPGTTHNTQNAFLQTGQAYCLSTADQRFLTGLGYQFTAAAAALFISGADCAPFAASAAAYADIVVAAPEPATLTLFTAAAATIGWLRRRRGAGAG